MKKLLVLLAILVFTPGCNNKEATKTEEVIKKDQAVYQSKVSSAEFEYPAELVTVDYQLNAKEFVGFFSKLDDNTIDGVSLAVFAVYEPKVFYEEQTIAEQGKDVLKKTVKAGKYSWQLYETQRYDLKPGEEAPVIRTFALEQDGLAYVVTLTYYPSTSGNYKYNDKIINIEEIFFSTFSL